MRITGRGFTLFEIAISLVVMAVSILSVMLVYPVGLKAQHQARFQLFAAAKAMELVECYNACMNMNPTLDNEAENPWDVPVNYRSMAMDLECKIASHRFGVNPVPISIAKRLDSDNDEIQRILELGGTLYYSQPQAVTGWEESCLPGNPPSEGQQLVFAVSGYAQDNGLYTLPWKAWPYYSPYPGPPTFLHHDDDLQGSPPGGPLFSSWEIGEPGYRMHVWEVTCDPDIQKVFKWTEAGVEYGFFQYGDPKVTNFEAAMRYCQAALWYCRNVGGVGLPPSYYDSISGPISDFSGSPLPPWRQVLAMKYLSHAATCLTAWKNKAELDVGILMPEVMLDTKLSAETTITHDKIVLYEQSCMRLAHLYGASFPYDWGAPRPMEGAVMMNHPLIQQDLFSPPLTGTIWGTSIAAEQWRPVAAQTITNIGTSASYPGSPISPAIWGDTKHFTLAAPFKPEERCRELVFWSVDWQAYEDFETAPSAAQDAGKRPRAAPKAGKTFADALTRLPWLDMHLYNYRNPEKAILFTESMAGVASGTDVTGKIVLNQGVYGDPPPPDMDFSIFSGLYGADRNFNHHLDRGPVPASVRMHASSVARFNFYDLRVQCVIR
jgi:hypothetical protein